MSDHPSHAWRTFFQRLFFLSLGALGFAFYLEHVQHIAPCPLCWMQRFMYVGIALIAGLGIFSVKTWLRRLYITCLFAFCGGGLGFAGRHIWLQHHPNAAHDCGASFAYALKHMPLKRLWQYILEGSTSCTQTHWQWLGLNLSEWSFLGFFAIATAIVLRWRGLRG